MGVKGLNLFLSVVVLKRLLFVVFLGICGHIKVFFLWGTTVSTTKSKMLFTLFFWVHVQNEGWDGKYPHSLFCCYCFYIKCNFFEVTPSDANSQMAGYKT